MAKLIQVIETSELRGAGVEGNPYRRVMQYFSADGTLLAEVDPEEQERARLYLETMEVIGGDPARLLGFNIAAMSDQQLVELRKRFLHTP